MISLFGEKVDNVGLRAAFVCLAMTINFVAGGAYYVFPLWLNFIVANHINLTRQALSLLGGMTYISLGLLGGILIWVKLFGFKNSNVFYWTTIVALICLLYCWFGLFGIISTERGNALHNFGFVLSMFLALGFGTGMFFFVWFGEVLALLQPQWIVVFLGLANVLFSLGAVFFLCLKLTLTAYNWVVLIASLVGGLCLYIFIFVTCFQHKFLRSDDVDTKSVESAKKVQKNTIELLKNLMFFRRSLDMDKSGCITSFQFYMLLLAYILVCSMGTTFLANIGVLTSHNSDTSGNTHASTIVLIWSASGQTLGRILVPFMNIIFNTIFGQRYDAKIQSNINNEVILKQLNDLRSLKVQNRSILLLTFIIAVLFFISLLFLRLHQGSMSFVTASTVISVGYGMMWSTVCDYPLFLPNTDYGIVCAFFQACGAFGTLTFVSLVSGLNLDNYGVFEALIIASIATMIAATVAFTSLKTTEPLSDTIIASS